MFTEITTESDSTKFSASKLSKERNMLEQL